MIYTLICLAIGFAAGAWEKSRAFAFGLPVYLYEKTKGLLK